MKDRKRNLDVAVSEGPQQQSCILLFSLWQPSSNHCFLFWRSEHGYNIPAYPSLYTIIKTEYNDWKEKCSQCRLRSIAAHRDHFVRRLSVCACVCLSDSRTFLIVTHTYVSRATHVFLGMLPLCSLYCFLFKICRPS